MFYSSHPPVCEVHVERRCSILEPTQSRVSPSILWYAKNNLRGDEGRRKPAGRRGETWGDLRGDEGRRKLEGRREGRRKPQGRRGETRGETEENERVDAANPWCSRISSPPSPPNYISLFSPFKSPLYACIIHKYIHVYIYNSQADRISKNG